jgi:hypothetical protein
LDFGDAKEKLCSSSSRRQRPSYHLKESILLTTQREFGDKHHAEHECKDAYRRNEHFHSDGKSIQHLT